MKTILLKGYKSIKELDLDLKPINILIGANGSGKSNFLSFFDFLKHIYKNNLREYVALKGIDTFLHNGNKVTSEIYSKLTFNNSKGYSINLKKGDFGFIFTHEGIWHAENQKDVNPQEINSFNYESNLMQQTIPNADYIIEFLNKLVKYHFHDTGVNSSFNQESNIDNDKFYLYEKGENLSAFLYNIKNDDKFIYNIIIKTIQSVAPYFHDFFLVPEHNGNIKLWWQSKYSSNIFGLNDFSDGTIRFIALTTLFLQSNPPETIIIDEPELGLHPSSIAKLSGLIKSASSKGSQVILATQSTDLISYFEPEDIVTVDQINGISKFERLDSKLLEHWLENYTIDDLWKRSIISSGQLNFN